METNVEKAYKLAVKTLRGNYRENGIYAGKNHFDDYWARDSFFSCLAALDLKDYEIVKKNLLLFIKNQKQSGEMPLRMGNRFILPKFLGIKIKKELKPRFEEDKNFSYPLDQNLLFVIAASEYVKKTKNKDFAKKYYLNFKSAINFILRYTDGTLLSESVYSNWEDSLKIRGHIIYTSVCYYKALKSISYLAKIFGDKLWEKNYSLEAERVKDEINNELWNGSYFSLMFYKGKRHDYFNTSGNLLAIYWGLADKQQALSIQHCLEEKGISKYVPSLTNHPSYPLKFVFFPLYLIGMGDYHNGQCWSWIGCLDALVKAKLGMKKESVLLLERIADKIIEYNQIYEVYEKNGKPVKRLFYKSEENFSWTAAFFILAYKEFF